MDPLSAVSLAGTVVAFVDFSLKLASKATEIWSSENGSSEEEASLEIVYEKLSECSANLSTAVGGVATAGGSQLPRSYACIRELAQACQTDCATMLRILKKLRESRNLEPGESSFKRRAKGLRGALKAVFKDPELKSVEGRLRRTQAVLTLELSTISIAYHEQHLQALGDLKETSADYETRHASQLGEIKSILDNMQQRHTAAKSSLAGTFHYDDVLGLERQMSRLSIATHDVAYQQDIIKGLEFESFHFRQHGIHEAHEETFHWALQEGKRAECQELLQRWLTDGTGPGVFWVSGKPGSGKSTFMKYVVPHDETRCKLDRWAQGHRLIIASHYFWCRGSPMQKSVQGMLRTLLLDIFRQYPHLISQAFDVDANNASRAAATRQIEWNVPQLRSTLERLISGEALGVKLCIFIDGLDECDGDHLDLCEYISKLSESPSVKFCVSSRPWNVFEDAFGKDMSTKLYMHELNHDDILVYTRSRLFEHPYWKSLLVKHADARILVEEIAKRSRGVFLWVFFVTRMLREGLTNHDSFTDLRKRLWTFPLDLHKFFRNIIETVDPIYQERMVGCLQLAQAAIEPLETLIYYFYDVQYDNDTHPPHQYSPEGLLDHDYKESLEIHTARRINAYCRGLLECRDGKVVFLHRTVADFLDTGEMLQLLAEKSRPGFDPLLSILDCMACLLETQRYIRPLLSQNWKMAMEYAALVEKRDDESSEMAYSLLNRLFGYLPLLPSAKSYEKSDFIQLTVEAHLIGYLCVCLQRNPAYCDCLDPGLIHVTLKSQDSSIKEKLLDMVFEHEQCRDIADSLRPSRVTKSFATFIKTVDLAGRPARKRVWRQFLEHGADPNVVISVRNDPLFKRSAAWVEIIKPAFKHRLGEADQQNVLETLDSLFNHGAQFSERPMGAQIYSLVINELRERGFVDKNQKIIPETYAEREFISNLMTRLLLRADWDISRFWPAVEIYLGARLLETMRASYLAAARERKHPTSMVKTSRPRSTSPGDLTARKRQQQPKYYVIIDSDDDDTEDRKPAIKSSVSGTVDDPISIDDASD